MLQELLGHCLELYQENRQQIAGLEEHLKEYGYDAQHSLASPADPLADVPAGGVCCVSSFAVGRGVLHCLPGHSSAMLHTALHARQVVLCYVQHCMCWQE